MFQRFVREESGLTAIEYALIAGGIFLVLIVAVQVIGQTLLPTFSDVAQHM